MRRGKWHMGWLLLVGLLLNNWPLAADEPDQDQAPMEQQSPGEAGDPPFFFNQKKLPESLDDILAIELALKEARARVREAVVAIEMGGGSGSGVIVSEDGLILSAAHVTAGVNKEITIRMPDGTKKEAISLGLRSDFDAAMARLKDPGPYPHVEIEKEIPALGEWVFSLGHSGGFDRERGFVTRVGRIVRKQEHTIQSDCTLIGGDSGGPLFNMHGKLVGIHSRVSRSLEQNMHVTIPIFTEKWDEMLAGEFLGEGPFASKIPGFLGVRVEEVEEVEEVEGGLKVTAVASDTAAADAGIQVGDVLLRFGEIDLKTRDDLEAQIGQSSAGAVVELALRRGDEELMLEVELQPKFKP